MCNYMLVIKITTFFNDVGKLITFQSRKYCEHNRSDPFIARYNGQLHQTSVYLQHIAGLITPHLRCVLYSNTTYVQLLISDYIEVVGQGSHTFNSGRLTNVMNSYF